MFETKPLTISVIQYVVKGYFFKPILNIKWIYMNTSSPCY